MKAFWKTSEFWGHVLTVVGTCAAAVAGVVSAPVAATVVGISQGAYALARAITKAGAQ